MTMRRPIAIVLALGALARPLPAQAPAPRSPNDTLHSPVIGANGSVTFQLFAPRATAVVLRSEGPAAFANQPLQKNEAGVWTYTVALEPDLYIYWYDVDSTIVSDPRNNNPRVNRTTVRSLLEVPGPAEEGIAERNVPHGNLAEVWYHSSSLDAPRRMHVYTPPGYGTTTRRYPVLYLLHGAGDNDESWPAVGRANFILDNLLAAGRIKPMIVVMPSGHTQKPGGLFQPNLPDPFIDDFLEDVMPVAERQFRILRERTNRAIAGLSMGGDQTLRIGLTNLDKFAYLGVFSSGILGGDSLAPMRFEDAHHDVFGDPRINDRIKLLWMGIGKEDFLLPYSRATRAVLDAHHVRYSYQESEGGHTWPNWRAYLTTFTPLLFR
jgi:enterochelin esterase-like enzyme